MAEFNLHNIRFYEFHPEAIHCIAFYDEEKVLALSRTDGSIEIWNCQFRPFKQQTIIGSKESSVESLVWCGNRLMSAGLNGFILEYNQRNFFVKSRTAVAGGPVWCLALSPNKQILAAGTEEGYVCLFEVNEEELVHHKILKKQESRILSLGWHMDNDHIVTGSVNYVNYLSTKTEECVVQFPVAKVSTNVETIVWCVGILHDGTIITGDSRGKTSFWEGSFGTLISSIQTHQADVLTMQVAPNSQSVYVAGVDPVIVEVRCVEGGVKHGRKKMWVKSVQRRIHTHDVRSLALTSEGKLFSGGVDTYLALSFYPPKTAIKFPATPPKNYISIARSSRFLLLGYKDRVELWKLGIGHSDSCEGSRFLHLDEDRIKVAEIELKKDKLEFCAVSPKSDFIAIIVGGKLKIYSLTFSQNTYKGIIQKVIYDDKIQKSSQVLWINDSILVSATHSNVLQILKVCGNEAVVLDCIELCSEKVCRCMAASEEGVHLATLDSTNQVTIYVVRESGFEVLAKIPKFRVPITAFCFIDTEEIFVAYSDMTMSEYKLSNGLYSSFGREMVNNPCAEILKSNNCIHNISFHPPNHIFLHSISTIYVINKSPIKGYTTPHRDNKVMKYETGVDTESNDSSSPVKMLSNKNISTVGRCNHLLHFSHIGDSQLISVELNPITLFDSLPPALKIKKFGAS